MNSSGKIASSVLRLIAGLKSHFRKSELFSTSLLTLLQHTGEAESDGLSSFPVVKYPSSKIDFYNQLNTFTFFCFYETKDSPEN